MPRIVDMKQVDKPYLRSYVSSLLALPDGWELVGNMISKAESCSELLNYEPEHIVGSAQALLKLRPLHFFESFARSVARDPDLLTPLVAIFTAQAESVKQSLSPTDAVNLLKMQDIEKFFQNLEAR